MAKDNNVIRDLKYFPDTTFLLLVTCLWLCVWYGHPAIEHSFV